MDSYEWTLIPDVLIIFKIPLEQLVYIRIATISVAVEIIGEMSV